MDAVAKLSALAQPTRLEIFLAIARAAKQQVLQVLDPALPLRRPPIRCTLWTLRLSFQNRNAQHRPHTNSAVSWLTGALR